MKETKDSRVRTIFVDGVTIYFDQQDVIKEGKMHNSYKRHIEIKLAFTASIIPGQLKIHPISQQAQVTNPTLNLAPLMNFSGCFNSQAEISPQDPIFIGIKQSRESLLQEPTSKVIMGDFDQPGIA